MAFILALSLLATGTSVQESSGSEEIPIKRCDRLPVVEVRIDGVDMTFLVDTAATSMLNAKSFSKQESKQVRRLVSSWSGTAATKARVVAVGALVLGSYRLRGLKLLAIDLSAIGDACGGQIDGILGIDLLEKMGATLDLKRRVALLPSESTSPADRARYEEYTAYSRACIEALNRADIHFLEGCFDPQIIMFTPWGEVHGRQEVLDYLRRRYFRLDPPAQFDFRERDVRALADVAWVAWNYTVKFPDGPIDFRATGLCRKSGGRWRMVSMHSSLVQAQESPQP